MAFGTSSFSAIQDRHVSPSEIGRKLGLDEKTVRVRAKRMEDEGFIKYYQVLPNLNLFGLGRVGAYRFETLNLATKYNLLRRTNDIPFVVEVIDYLGQHVSVAIAGQSHDEVRRASEKLASEFELARRELHQRQIMDCGLRPDRLDWQIIKGLRYSARRSSTDLAKSIGITPRMAEYRIGRLMDTSAMLVRTAINPRKQTGLVFYELELTVGEQQGTVSGELQRIFGERLWSTLVSSGVLIASLFGFSLGEAEDDAMASSKIPGVKSSLLYVLKETTEPRGPNWIDRLVEEKAGQD